MAQSKTREARLPRLKRPKRKVPLMRLSEQLIQKRALRVFGNSAGNCLYSKDYNKQIARMTAPKSPPLQMQDLYRQHPNTGFKPETSAPKPNPIPKKPASSDYDDEDQEFLAADLECIDAALFCDQESKTFEPNHKRLIDLS